MRRPPEGPSEQPAPTQHVGRYQLVERLAVGGMAEVFLACERGSLALERLLVIKRILPHLAQDPTFVDMFLHEARVAARIHHPNVVQIYELGESGGFPYIAMEYVPGSTLKDLIKASQTLGAPLPIPVVVELISQACAGAHAAHELTDPSGNSYGLVHRDLTPHNLMVTDDGHVKLLDFGIAKASELQDEQTRTGMLKGKISYMSPEQCRQEAVDRRSDVFALGICAWELLTGDKPFQGASELATMQAIVRGQVPDLRERRPDVPETLASVVHRAMVARPESRWQTAEQFRERLRDAARQAGFAADPDLTARTVVELLGDRHERKRSQVGTALERSLTLSKAQPTSDLPRVPSEEVTRASIQSATTGLAVGAIGSLFALAALTVGALSFGAGWYWYANRPTPRPPGEPLVILIAPSLDPEVSIRNLEPVRAYLEREVDVPFDFVVASSYEDTAGRLLNRTADFAVMPHGIGKATLEQNPDVEILATKIMDGSATTDGYLLVPRSSDIQRPEELKGKRVCYPDLNSSTGYKLPRAKLAESGLDPDNDIVWVHSGTHDQVLRDIIAGECDAGGTYSLNFQGANQIDVQVGQLRLLVVTGQVPHDHVMTHSGVDAALRERVAKALVAFDPRKEEGVYGVGDTEKLTGFAPGDGLGTPP